MDCNVDPATAGSGRISTLGWMQSDLGTMPALFGYGRLRLNHVR